MYGNRAGGGEEKKDGEEGGVGGGWGWEKKRWGRGGRGEQVTKNIKVQKGTGF